MRAYRRWGSDRPLGTNSTGEREIAERPVSYDIELADPTPGQRTIVISVDRTTMP